MIYEQMFKHAKVDVKGFTALTLTRHLNHQTIYVHGIHGFCASGSTYEEALKSFQAKLSDYEEVHIQ